jgi:single-strand DNA-binding protein
MGINLVVGTGTVAEDAALEGAGDKASCAFAVFLDNKKKRGEEWVNYPVPVGLTLFGTRAEETAPLLKKGAFVSVRGRLSSLRIEEGGKIHSRLSVHAQEVNVIAGKKPASCTGLNVVCATGWTKRDYELRETANGGKVGQFVIAVENRYKSGEEWVDNTVFLRLAVFDERAETLAPNLYKGREIGVYGKLELDEWTDADGREHSALTVMAGEIKLMCLPKNAKRRPVLLRQTEGGADDV